MVNWEVPEATDNIDPPSDILVLQTSGPERGSVLTIGETYITYMAEDTAGNPSTNNCSITVSVKGWYTKSLYLLKKNTHYTFICIHLS